MKVTLYLDEDAQDNDLLQALQAHGADVVRADEEQFLTATVQGRVLYGFNVGDYFKLHTAFLQQGRSHAGIVLAKQQHYSVGEQMRRLLKLITVKSAEELRDQLEFLSDWG